jgi:hypothetical protein
MLVLTGALLLWRNVQFREMFLRFVQTGRVVWPPRLTAGG